MSRRAFLGTIPALVPGTKIGDPAFQPSSDGAAPFIKERFELFDQLKKTADAQQAALPREAINVEIVAGDLSKTVVQGLSNELTPAKAAELAGIVKQPHILAKVRYDQKELNAPQIANTEQLEEQEDEDDNVQITEQEAAEDQEKDWQLWDLHRPLKGSCKVKFLTFEDKECRGIYWHSAAHLLGLACEEVLGCQMTIGPPLERGFYYDFYLGETATVNEEHYAKLETAATAAAQAKWPFERLEVSKEEALMLFESNPFKVALIAAKVPQGGRTSVYRCGKFVDLCTGPHIPHLGWIKVFEVEKQSSAYWLGDRNGDSLQRVYGIAFPDAKMLKEHKAFLEEARRRDHRTLGQQLDLFFFDSKYAAGSAFWLPRGARVYNKLIDLMRSEYLHRGFTEVISPNLYSSDLFQVSGHLENYKENMFLTQVEGKLWGLKPMNCPGHCCMFRHMAPSYKQLPIRLADFGVLHRNEFSGSLSGLTRVRRFQQDDAHIFCTLDQIQQEVSKALDFLFFTYEIFGFKFQLYLATRPKKALGEIALWTNAETQLKQALDQTNRPWKLNKGDGAFYGPKIDICLLDALDRQHQCGTIQLDFQLPIRFDLQYRAAENTAEEAFGRPVMIHRAILGSVERMTAVILEHTAGRLPFWLSPRQAVVCPISEKSLNYAQYIYRALLARGYDVGVDASSNTINKKIRDAQVHQWNYILVVGAVEEEERCVMVRKREDPKNQTKMSLPDVLVLFEELRDITKRLPKSALPDFNPEIVY